MKVTTTSTYNVEKSAARMDEILDSSNYNYEDKKILPDRDLLTCTNGFYVNVTSLVIKIFDSVEMTDEHEEPVLAKIYRSFISECTAIMNSYSICKEININGDCVWGIFDTALKRDTDVVFQAACQMHSMLNILNYKLQKKGYRQISAGIGIDYGKALMMKVGYSGSELTDVVWMGDVVNQASYLSRVAGRGGRRIIMVSPVVYEKLNTHNKSLFGEISVNWIKYYHSDAIITGLEKWYDTHCK